MAVADLSPKVALPPGAANVEDDVKAWEAVERRAPTEADGCAG